jgi:hypothetical protein
MDKSCILRGCGGNIKTAPCRAAGKGYPTRGGGNTSEIALAQPPACMGICSAFLPPKNRNNQRKRQVSWLMPHRSPCLPILQQTVASQELLRIYSGGTAPDLHRPSLLSRLHMKKQQCRLFRGNAHFQEIRTFFQSLLNFNIPNHIYYSPVCL